MFDKLVQFLQYTHYLKMEETFWTYKHLKTTSNYFTANCICLSIPQIYRRRCSTDLRYILGHSVYDGKTSRNDRDYFGKVGLGKLSVEGRQYALTLLVLLASMIQTRIFGHIVYKKLSCFNYIVISTRENKVRTIHSLLSTLLCVQEVLSVCIIVSYTVLYR